MKPCTRRWSIVAAVLLAGPCLNQALAQDVALDKPRFIAAWVAPGEPSDASAAPALQRRVSLSLTDAPLRVALREIAKQARLDLTYNRSLLPPDARVSIHARQLTVVAALTEVLLNSGLDVAVGSSGQLALVRRATPAVEPARDSVVAGVVLSTAGTPIHGATVAVVGTPSRVVTDATGRFRLLIPTGTEPVLRASAIGYQPLSRTVRVGDQDVRLVMAEVPIKLDEVVVTGTPGGTQRRALGNAVGRVNMADVIGTVAVQNVEQGLGARVPGVVINTANGNAGSGSRIQMRGLGSLTLDDSPIIIVDGVRINSDNFQRIPSGITFQDAQLGTREAAVSRINDLNPEDIESIEIIKGPAAATLYGTEATSGVIQIITKRGRPGRTTFAARIRQGTAALRNPEGVMPWRYTRDASGQVDSINLVVSEALLGNRLFHTGRVQGYGASLTGGSETLRYHIGADLDREEGVRPSNAITRFAANTNLTIRPASTLDVETSLGLVVSGLEFPGGLYADQIISANPLRRNLPARGAPLMPPDVLVATREFTQDLHRYTASIRLDHRPARWFSHRLTVGSDLTAEQNNFLFPLVAGDNAQFFSPVARLGGKDIQRKDASFTTVDYSASLRLGLVKWLTSTTSVGGQYYRRVDQFESLSGQQFPAIGVETVSGGALRTSAEDLIENSTVGLYVQNEFAIRGRLFLTAALRADDNSAFGADFDLVTYPKVSVSWVVNEEPFWKVPFINTLRVRGAYGEAGRQPASFAALRSYLPITGVGGAPGGTPQFLGNPELGPERGREIEVGFEAGLLADRLSIDFTYYNQRTRDAIIARGVAPSTGFPGTQFINAGEVQNKGVEVLVNARPLDTRRVDWDVTAAITTSDNQVVRLGLPNTPFLTVGFLANRFQPGFPVSAYFLRRIVSAAIDPNTRQAVNIMCEGTSAPVPCNSSAPSFYVGPIAPTSYGSLSTSVTLFDRLRLYGSVDFKLGHHVLDANHFSGCGQGRHEIRIFPERFDPRVVAECQLGLGYTVEGLVEEGGYLLQDASYAKLRELSIAYSLPRQWSRRLFAASDGTVNLSFRNITTWTGFHGFDPEVFATDNYMSSNHNQYMLPMPFSFSASFRLTY